MVKTSAIRTERRGEWRYRFSQPLQFRALNGTGLVLGGGQSVELGAGGLLFDSDRPVEDGEDLEVQITWPVRAQGVCPVVLMVKGTVLRTDIRGTALRIRSYAFHMEADRAIAGIARGGAFCDVTG